MNVIDVTEWVWVFDNSLMICRKVGKGVIIDFEKVGDEYKGKLQGTPMALFEKKAELAYREKIIEQIARSAEEDYLKVYFGQ